MGSHKNVGLIELDWSAPLYIFVFVAAGGVGRVGCGGRRTVIEALETSERLQCMRGDGAELPSGQMCLFAFNSSGFF